MEPGLLHEARKRRNDIKRDAHSCQRRTCKRRAGKVRVHDRIRPRQRGTGEVMVGHQHRDVQAPRGFHALDAGHAVVHGHDQRRCALRGQSDDFGCQPVTVAIGHQEIDVREAHRAQCANHERAAGRAVGVEVPDHQHSSGGAVPRQQLRRRVDAGK